jgi:hypothetical protein
MGLMWSWKEWGLEGQEENCESFHCIQNWSFLWDHSFGEKVRVTIEKKEKNMEASCIFILVMENSWWIFNCLVGVCLHLKYDKMLGRLIHIRMI